MSLDRVPRSDTLPKLSMTGLASTVLALHVAERYRALRLRRRSLDAGRLVPSPTGNELLVVEDWPAGEVAADVPVLVFENAMSSTHHAWAWVAEAMGSSYPVVRYDRAGYTASRAARPRLTAGDLLTDLEAVIEATRRGRRVVLVGHSIGGLIALAFSARRPDLLAGLVLVDSSHPDQLKESKRQREGATHLEASLKQLPWCTWLGLGALLFPATWEKWLPPDAARGLSASYRSHGHWAATAREWRVWQDEIDPLAREVTSVDVPMLVITAGDNARQDPVHALLQERLAALSQRSEMVLVEGASHDGLVMRAERAQVLCETMRRFLSEHVDGASEVAS